MNHRLGVLVCALAPLVMMQPSLAQEDQGGMAPMEAPDTEVPTPLADPYEPDPGDPNPFAAEDAPSEAPGPLNPADN